MATILMAAGEGLPFIKSGGLADVIGSLAPELVKKGHEVRVVMPLYKKIAEKYHQDFYFEKEYSVSINYHEVPVRLFSIIKNNVVFYFIEHQGYLTMTASALRISRRRSSRCSTSSITGRRSSTATTGIPA